MTLPEQAEVDRLVGSLAARPHGASDRLARAQAIVAETPLQTPRHRASGPSPVPRSDDAGPEVARLMALANKISRSSPR